MQLLEVELTGFKSFAHKTIFRLSDGLTAIIGPNGSGKSNFAEAIRWVLGEQSLKSLRGRTSADVIFAGSSGHKRGSVAAVSLTFSNEDKRLAVEAPEVTFTRRLHRDGESEYLLNGDPVRLFDVQQLLADAGIGTKSYAVISQGTVDRYLTATPAQRRELFDEATGIKALQLKVQRSERHLHQVTQQLQELQAIIQELEPRLKVLQRQVARHAERLTVSERLAQEQATWFHHEWHQRSQALAQTKQSLAQTQARIAAARSNREAVEQELLLALENKPTTLTELQSQVQIAEQAYQAAAERYHAQVQEREALERSLQTIAQERQHAAANVQRAREQLTTKNIFGGLRPLLEQCQHLCEAWLKQQPIDRAEITTLRDAIAEQLKQMATENATVNAAHDLLQQLEGPLQTVARLTALEEERRTRLHKLAILTLPSTAELTTLRQQLATTQRQQPGREATAAGDRQATLDHVRTEELQAEREGSTVAAQVAQAEALLSHLISEIRRERGSAFLAEIQTTPPPPTSVTEHDLQLLAARLAQLGEIDHLALKEYEETADRYTHLQQQLRDIETTYHKTQQLISTLQREMNVQFRQQFSVIHDAFRRHVKRLFEGGEAELAIVVSDDEETLASTPVPGIEITVHPPGKKPQHVGLLSGGEKALTSLALLFAILEVQQPPFLVLDEVDAALDEANSWRFAELLREKSQTTQCIVISHNRETMGHADVLYGITMQQDGISRSYSVKLQEMSHTEAVEEMPL